MKKIKILICALFTMVLMTGCVKYETGFVVKSEKEMDVSMKILLSPLLTSEMELTAEDLKQAFEDSMNQENNTTKSDETISMEESNIFSDVDEYSIETVYETFDDVTWEGIIVTAKVPEDHVSEYVFTDVDGSLVFSMSAEQSGEFTGDIASEENDAETINQYKSMGMAMKIMITMPSTPTTNHGTIEGNTVIVDLLSEEYMQSEDKSIVVYSAPLANNSSLNMANIENLEVYIAIGACVLLLSVGIVVYIKKRRA